LSHIIFGKYGWADMESAPGWQGAKAQEYQDISALSERSQAGCIGA